MSVTTPQHHRVGAHRARRNPVAVTATAVGSIVVLSALLVWGLLATDIIGGSSTGTAADTTATAGSAVVDGSEGVESAAPVVPEPSVVASAPPPSAAPPPSEPAAPLADQAATITVLNGGVTVAGVARGTAASLVAAGWTGVDEAATANAPNFPDVESTIVAYADPALQVTAEAVVASVGGGAALLTSEYASAGFITQIVVVLGADYTPPA